MSFEIFENFKRFQNRSILAVDYGEKVTGLAFFTPGKEPFPQPYGRFIYKDEKTLISDISKLIDDEFFEVLVIGIPHLTDGSETAMTKKIKLFTNALKLQLPKEVEIYFQDETLTTKEAESRMKNSPRYNFKINLKEIDALSASIILEDFIRSEFCHE